jgi:Transcriptional regulator PadR-like family.
MISDADGSRTQSDCEASDDESHGTLDRGVDGTPTDDGAGVTVDQLYNEVSVDESASSTAGVRLTPDQQSEVALDRALSALSGGEGFSFDESMVKNNLDEILLVLVALRPSDANGKSLMGDLAALFDTRVSPGTVYPQLHELEDDDLLRVQELVRTKEYLADDEEKLAEHVAAAMEQHLALGLFFEAALEELS